MASKTFIEFLKTQSIEEIAETMIEMQKEIDDLKLQLAAANAELNGVQQLDVVV